MEKFAICLPRFWCPFMASSVQSPGGSEEGRATAGAPSAAAKGGTKKTRFSLKRLSKSKKGRPAEVEVGRPPSAPGFGRGMGRATRPSPPPRGGKLLSGWQPSPVLSSTAFVHVLRGRSTPTITQVVPRRLIRLFRLWLTFSRRPCREFPCVAPPRPSTPPTKMRPSYLEAY